MSRRNQVAALAEEISGVLEGKDIEDATGALALLLVHVCRSAGMTRKEFRISMGEQWDSAFKAIRQAMAKKVAAASLLQAQRDMISDVIGGVDDIAAELNEGAE